MKLNHKSNQLPDVKQLWDFTWIPLVFLLGHLLKVFGFSYTFFILYLYRLKIDFGAPAAHEQFVDLMERPRPELGVVSVIAG